MNPRRYSQIERALTVLDKSGTVDILKEDQYLLFLFKKTERIVAALFVITSLFFDSEPLKWSLRESGTSLLKHTLSFKERALVHSKEFLSDTLSEMARLLSLIDLAYIADLISPMNFSILKKELEIISGIIDGKWRMANIPVSPPLFQENFFGLSKEIFSEAKKESRNEASTPVAASGSEFGEENTALQSFSEFERLKRSQKDIFKGHIDIKDNVLNKYITTTPQRPRVLSLKNSSLPSTLRPTNQVKEERKQQILTLLHQQNKAVIKDFSSVITGCSEKTIQRLIIEMVSAGVLKREGNRRWSRYSIV